jgi:ferric-dicitrate binding protein FerR (iron transport regulator)
MKLNENNPQHAEIITRYLNGEMNQEELADFEIQINSSEEDKLLVEEMKKQWMMLANFQDKKTPDARKAWDKMHSRLADEKQIPDQTAVAQKRIVYYFMRAAAVVLLLLATGALIYFGISRKQNIGIVNLKTGIEPNTLVKTLTDGSIIYIAQNSSFSFPKQFKKDTRNVELSGAAFFDIAHDPAKPFIIETDEVFIQVFGTAFNVKTKNGSNFELIVDRGKVKVTMKNDPDKYKFVEAGEKIISTNNNLFKSKTTVSDNLSWYTKRMHFKDESLKNIINVLNRNFNAIFVLADMEAGNRRLTVTFNNESADTIAELICLTLNLKSEIKNGSIVLSEIKDVPK